MTASTTTHPARKPRARRLRPVAPFEIDLNDDRMAAIRSVALAASKDLARPILNGVHVVSDGEAVEFVATDSYRLHFAQIAQALAPPVNCLIPAGWLVKALRDLASRFVYPVLRVTEGVATMTNPDESRSIKLIDIAGPAYPDVNAILDQSESAYNHPDLEVGVDPRFFSDLLKACAMFGDTTAARFKVTGQRGPTRFDVRHNDVRFIGLLMTMRIT